MINMDKNIIEPYISPLKPIPTQLSVSGELGGPVHCLLCDIYGTLFISGCGDIGIARKQEIQHQAIASLLTKFHMSISPSALLESFYQAIQTTHEKARNLGVDYPEVQIDEIWTELLPIKNTSRIRNFAVQFEMIMNPVWPMPGLCELIQFCREKDIHLGIISNAQFFTPMLFQWFLDADVQTMGFERQLTFYSYQCGRAKPSPHMFQLADNTLKKMGILPHQVAYIGNDMRNDILPAKQMGFQTILFAGDFRSLRLRQDDPYTQNIKPDLCITHLKELISFL